MRVVDSLFFAVQSRHGTTSTPARCAQGIASWELFDRHRDPNRSTPPTPWSLSTNVQSLGLLGVANDADYHTWASSQRRPVECLHCGLFVLGSIVVLDCWGSLFKGLPKPHEWLELFLFALHCACLYFLKRKNEKGKQLCYFIIRLVAGCSFLVMGEDKTVRDEISRYAEGTILRVAICQLGPPIEVGVSCFQILVAFWRGGWDGWPLVVPPLVAFVLEFLLRQDYESFMEKKATERVYAKGTRSEPVLNSGRACVDEAGASSGSGVCTSSCTAPPPPVLQTGQQALASEPKLRVDISRFFKDRGVSGNTTPSFSSYKPVVAVKSKTIKVFNKDATEAEIQRYAEVFATNMASTRKQNGKLTVVKGVGIRGCILLMAGVMDNELKGCEGGVGEGGSFDDAARELISCLPADLQGLDMDVTIDTSTGRFVRGHSGPVSMWQVDEYGADLPEVVLVSEPCAVMNKQTNLDICFSESEGDWESIKAVLVLGDEVLQTKDVESDSTSFEVHGSDEQIKSGYIRTLGVTKSDGSGKGKTVVSSIAPFLRMPKVEAQELNGLFDKTVLEAVKTDGSTHEKQRKNVWKEQFKPFALDMQYIMDLDVRELRLLMSDEMGGDLKWEYLGVFQRLADFLKDCNANYTHRYLERVLVDAGIELVGGDEERESEVCTAPPEPQQKSYFPAAAGPSDVPKSDESPLDTEFNFWRGFDDPALEAQYKLHLSQNLVLVDFVGIIMGLCLLPIMWQFIKDGEHLYLCPLMTHFLVCASWFLFSERTYVHSRQPVVVLLWIVRLAVFVGQVAYKGWHTLVVSGVWNMAALGAWFVVVKPRVMKMALSDFMLLSLLDLACWLGIVVISFICEDVAAGVTSFALALFCVATSCMMGYFSERDDRNGFAASIESARPSSSK